MYILGTILLAAGAFLLVVFSPWLYLDPRGATGVLDFTEVFWYAQWGGFWLTLASLLCFGVSYSKAPLSGRAIVAPGIAALLTVLFFACSMPEASNQREWCKGVLGLPVYVKTKLRLAADAEGVDGLPKRFAGTWKSGGVRVLTIGADSVAVENGASKTLMSKQSCPHRFAMEYRLTSPSGLFEYFREGRATEADFRQLHPHDYPVLLVDCGMTYTVFVLLDRHELLVLSRYAPPQILKA